MLGFTGTYRGERVSVQGSGMGLPSFSIYAHELFAEYDVQAVVRVGSCGALSEDLAVRDIVIASGACTDSSMNRIRFEGLDYAPVADFGLLRAAVEAAEEMDLPVQTKVGLIMSSDSFYSARPSWSPGWRTTASSRSRWRPPRCTPWPRSSSGAA